MYIFQPDSCNCRSRSWLQKFQIHQKYPKHLPCSQKDHESGLGNEHLASRSHEDGDLQGTTDFDVSLVNVHWKGHVQNELLHLLDAKEGEASPIRADKEIPRSKSVAALVSGMTRGFQGIVCEVKPW
jgi:hypothetical protein